MGETSALEVFSASQEKRQVNKQLWKAQQESAWRHVSPEEGLSVSDHSRRKSTVSLFPEEQTES